ncbi:MAG: PEP-CTERM sorting domain-containing protein [Proteobacteria bacterium]|nr:PEP-CTERM sorting domain-containing protein [Pseudomonadota bacterium]
MEVDSSFKVEGFDPIPEPASIFALGLGAAALAARRRRKKA